MVLDTMVDMVVKPILLVDKHQEVVPVNHLEVLHLPIPQLCLEVKFTISCLLDLLLIDMHLEEMERMAFQDSIPHLVRVDLR